MGYSALVSLRARDGDMVLSTMHFYEEVQQNQYKNAQRQVDEKELELAKTIVRNLSGKFDIAAYKDEYREKLQKAIQQKIQGKEIVTPKDKEGYKNVIDLMDALKQSIEISAKKQKTETEKAKKAKKRA